MELQVVQRFTVLDEFEYPHKVVQVQHSDAPDWLDRLVVPVYKGDIRLALDRYAIPLLLKLSHTPKQCLDRVPQPHRRCHLWGPGCFGWHEKKCQNLRNNPCELLRIVDVNGEFSLPLTEVVNLWRDDCNVVRVVNKNGEFR